MMHITTLGNCLEHQPSLRNPGTSQCCESFSEERRGSTQRENDEDTKKMSHLFRKLQLKITLLLHKIPSRQREWSSMKNLALLEVFTMASTDSSSMLALSLTSESASTEMEKNTVTRS